MEGLGKGGQGPISGCCAIEEEEEEEEEEEVFNKTNCQAKLCQSGYVCLIGTLT
jgi:hypothetical protein